MFTKPHPSGSLLGGVSSLNLLDVMAETIIHTKTRKVLFSIVDPFIARVDGCIVTEVRALRPDIIIDCQALVDANLGIVAGFEIMDQMLPAMMVMLTAGLETGEKDFVDYDSKTVRDALVLLERLDSPFHALMSSKAGKVLKSDAEKSFRTGSQDSIGHALVNNIRPDLDKLGIAPGFLEMYRDFGFVEAYQLHAALELPVPTIAELRVRTSYLDTSTQAIYQALESWSKIAIEAKREHCEQLLDLFSTILCCWESQIASACFPAILIKLKQADMEFSYDKDELRQTANVKELFKLAKDAEDKYQDYPPSLLKLLQTLSNINKSIHKHPRT